MIQGLTERGHSVTRHRHRRATIRRPLIDAPVQHASFGILVRLHPANTETREGAKLDGIENAVVWPEHTKVQTDPAPYDSLYHAAAVAGLNTSAMIEAGIVDSQEQSLHFHCLLAANGGPVEVADDRRQHVRQQADTLTRPEEGAERSRRFIESFVRPLGLDQPVAPLVVDEIERGAALPKRPHHPPMWKGPARRVLLAPLKRRVP